LQGGWWRWRNYGARQPMYLRGDPRATPPPLAKNRPPYVPYLRCRRRRPSHGGRRRREVSSSHKSKPHPNIRSQMAPDLEPILAPASFRVGAAARDLATTTVLQRAAPLQHTRLDSGTSVGDACLGVRGSNPCRQRCCTARRARSFHHVVNDDGTTPCGSGALICDDSP
jgi:hypothetical protein